MVARVCDPAWPHETAGVLILPPSALSIQSSSEIIAELLAKWIQSLEGGMEFRNGDHRRDERVTVERGFRRADGQIRTLVETSRREYSRIHRRHRPDGLACDSYTTKPADFCQHR